MFDKLFSGFASPRRLREAGILGMNRRNYNVIAKNNRRRLYPLVDDKVQTKMLANKIGINTPGLIVLPRPAQPLRCGPPEPLHSGRCTDPRRTGC